MDKRDARGAERFAREGKSLPSVERVPTIQPCDFETAAIRGRMRRTSLGRATWTSSAAPATTRFYMRGVAPTSMLIVLANGASVTNGTRTQARKTWPRAANVLMKSLSKSRIAA